MKLALYQPDIAPNVGTLLRLGACMNVAVDIIEPCGFPFGAKDLRRAAMDYADLSSVKRYPGWDAFIEENRDRRLILLTTKSADIYTEVAFEESDILILGRESAGVPETVHDRADLRITIPMQPGMRSINVAVSAAMVLGEALRQTDGFPPIK